MAMPLDGIRVIELNRVAPGSLTTMMLGDMGAEVIRIETPENTGGTKDMSARNEATWRRSEFANRNKKSVTLNLKSAEAQQVLQTMARDADILVEGFRPGVTARLGADFTTLSAINPRLVYCSLSGFGQEGPYRDKAGHDLNYLALAGVLGLIGEPDGAPAIPLNIIADYAGATLHGVIGILLALLARQQTGRGQHVDVAYLDTTFALLAAVPGVRNFFIGGHEPRRGAQAFAGQYPYYSVYPTRDGQWFSVGCTEPWLWHNFCDAIERPDLRQFAMHTDDFHQPPSAESRAAHATVSEIMKTRTRDEWTNFFADHDVCVSPVNGFAEAVDDQQLRARGMIEPVIDAAEATDVQPGIAVKLSDTPGAIRGRAPTTGEHNDEVLGGLGYDAETRDDWRRRGII